MCNGSASGVPLFIKIRKLKKEKIDKGNEAYYTITFMFGFESKTMSK